MTNGPFDVAVIGAGATGGWVAKQLAERGLRVVVLEAGAALDPSTFDDRIWMFNEPRPLAADDIVRQPVQSKHGFFTEHSRRYFVDDVDNPYTTAPGKPFYWIRSRQLGGRSLLWGGVSLRLSDFELRAGSRDGLSDDWPLSYKDLEEAYDLVERATVVCGSREGLAQLPDGPYCAALPLTPSELDLKRRIEARWSDRHVIPIRVVRSRAVLGPSGQWPQFSSMGSTLAAAVATGYCELRPQTIVRRILVDAETNRADVLDCLDAARRSPFEVKARAFVLCGSTLETTRLLLNSATPDHPSGLGNSSDTLGRFLMDHWTTFMIGAAREPSHDADWEMGSGGNETVPHFMAGGVTNGFMIPKFLDLAAKPEGFRRGYTIQGGVGRPMSHRDLDLRGKLPVLLAAIGETLPYRHNRAVLEPNLVDAWGVPVLRIDYALGPNERAMAAHAERTLEEIADAGGFDILRRGSTLESPGMLIHEVGTARMGQSARDSVVDVSNRCWDVENLYVVDGACWVTSGWQNPTLTMMAIAARAADRLAGVL